MNNYEDIINLKHYNPKFHSRMSIYNRSAQFAPFAALTGYDEAIVETSRITDNKIELSDDLKYFIDLKLQMIENIIEDKPILNILYFEKDKNKLGGKYIEYTGNIKKIDLIEQFLIFVDGKRIHISDVFDLNID